MKKQTRSYQKRISRDSKILRYMRMARGMTVRSAGRLAGCSDSLICHLETGRLDVTERRVLQLIQVYGFSVEEFGEYRNGKPLPVVSVKDECIKLLDLLDDTKLNAVHAVLVSFGL